jgi:hypothetical protein
MALADMRERVDAVPSDRLETLFEEAFQALADSTSNEMDIPEFEVAVVKDAGKKAEVRVTVMGIAGSTTQDDFCSKEDGKIVRSIGGSEKVIITLDDDTEAEFELVDVVNLRTIEYMVVYQVK